MTAFGRPGLRWCSPRSPLRPVAVRSPRSVPRDVTFQWGSPPHPSESGATRSLQVEDPCPPGPSWGNRSCGLSRLHPPTVPTPDGPEGGVLTRRTLGRRGEAVVESPSLFAPRDTLERDTPGVRRTTGHPLFEPRTKVLRTNPTPSRVRGVGRGPSVALGERYVGRRTAPVPVILLWSPPLPLLRPKVVTRPS